MRVNILFVQPGGRLNSRDGRAVILVRHNTLGVYTSIFVALSDGDDLTDIVFRENFTVFYRCSVIISGINSRDLMCRYVCTHYESIDVLSVDPLWG